MKAIRVHTPGGPEALRLEDIPEPKPEAGQAVVKIEAAGVNFIDVYQRTGLYKVPLPFTLGQEAAGSVASLGTGVSEPRVGTRVAYCGILGAYAPYAVVPADRLVVLPDGVSTKQGAAAMLQGMTAHYLATTTYPLKAGTTCVVHAAAGGVGLLLCQIARRQGARVIGTVSTREKAALAREAGAHDVILYTEQDFEVEVKRLTDNRGVEVIYDSVGKTTFDKGLNCLTPRGLMVLYGQSSGRVGPAGRGRLARRDASRARAGNQLDRHRRGVRSGPFGRGGRTPAARAARGRATARVHQVWPGVGRARPHDGSAPRTPAGLDPEGVRSVAAPPRNRAHRPLPVSLARRDGNARGGVVAGDGAARRARQSTCGGGVELHRPVAAALRGAWPRGFVATAVFPDPAGGRRARDSLVRGARHRRHRLQPDAVGSLDGLLHGRACRGARRGRLAPPQPPVPAAGARQESRAARCAHADRPPARP